MPVVLQPLQVLAGVEPSLDRTVSTTQHYTFTKGIRFKDGLPEKVGGWQSLTLNQGDEIQGVVRSIFSYKLNGLTRFLMGSNTRLYDLFGTQEVNITPFREESVDAPNSLDTLHGPLGSNPFETVAGSMTITITDSAHPFIAGDIVTISGAVGVNGIPASELNSDLFIRSVTENTYSVIVDTAASSSGSGGGGSVVRASGYITLNAAGHGLVDGDRIKIEGATSVGGIADSNINSEFEIRNVTADSFDVLTSATSANSVNGSGGASVVYREPIPSGLVDTLLGQGYGSGLYGTGLYGVSNESLSTSPPRIWSHDRFGDLTISASGDQGRIYSWDGGVSNAPTIISGSPPANYAFVSNEIVVALGYDSFGAGEAENGISWSDQGGLTNWVSGQAGSDSIEGAGRFISHASARGENLLFTEEQVYTFRYIGGQFIWQTRLLDPSVGLIAQNARVSASGVVYWMSNGNFYMWRGGAVEVIPSNSSPESTVLNYVFDDFNFSQKEKVFAWYNLEFREVQWHYPSSGSNEPDRVVRLNLDDFSWAIDELERTAAEYPSILSETPYLIDVDNTIFLHENGLNDDDEGLDWQINTPFVFGGSDTTQISAFIPDYNLTGSASVDLETKEYPLSNGMTRSFTLSPTTDRVSTEQNGRYWQYRLSGSDLDQVFQSGVWQQEVMRSSPK